MTEYRDMFVWNATKPIQGTLTLDLWEAKKKVWLAKQERLCAVINNCLSYNGCEAVKNLSTITKIIAKIKSRFQPSGSAVFTAFDYEYNKLSLSDCNNVIDFAEKLCKAKNKLLKLDTFCKIGKPHFIHKFLSSLGPSFDIFCTIFSQTHSLLPIKAADKIASTAAITFDKTVMAAKKEK